MSRPLKRAGAQCVSLCDIILCRGYLTGRSILMAASKILASEIFDAITSTTMSCVHAIVNEERCIGPVKASNECAGYSTERMHFQSHPPIHSSSAINQQSPSSSPNRTSTLNTHPHPQSQPHSGTQNYSRSQTQHQFPPQQKQKRKQQSHHHRTHPQQPTLRYSAPLSCAKREK